MSSWITCIFAVFFTPHIKIIRCSTVTPNSLNKVGYDHLTGITKHKMTELPGIECIIA